MIVKSNIQLHPGQERLRLEILRNPVRYNTINLSRQWGKSVFGKEILNFVSFNYHEYEKNVLKPKFLTKLVECKIIWTSPTIQQAKKVYKEVKRAWKPILFYHNETDRILIAKNGTQVQFFGVDKPDNIRGEGINYMICDEFAFYKEGVFETVLRPMLLTQGKMFFLISTPNGLNEFYKYHQRGVSGEYPQYKYVTGTYQENPFYDVNEIEDAQKTLPEPIFEQEYLAKFVGGGASIFGNFERLMILNEWSEPISTMEYYAGTDLAKQKDWTVTTTIDKNHKVVNMLRMRQIDWNEIINQVVKDFNRYKPYALMEINNIGDAIYDLVRNKYEQVQPFATTNQSKQMIIQNLISACNVGSLKLPTKELFPVLHEEMNMFTFDYSPEKRQIVYKAREGFHDDTIISLALANMQYKRFNGLNNI